MKNEYRPTPLQPSEQVTFSQHQSRMTDYGSCKEDAAAQVMNGMVK